MSEERSPQDVINIGLVIRHRISLAAIQPLNVNRFLIIDMAPSLPH